MQTERRAQRTEGRERGGEQRQGGAGELAAGRFDRAPASLRSPAPVTRHAPRHLRRTG
jgi:hypothetical protein